MKKMSKVLLSFMATLTIGVNATSIHQCPPHWQQYINKTFNFSFCFPRQAQLKDHFLSGYFISKAWTVMNNSRVLSVGQHQVTSVNLINVDTSRHQLPATDSFLAMLSALFESSIFFSLNPYVIFDIFIPPLLI